MWGPSFIRFPAAVKQEPATAIEDVPIPSIEDEPTAVMKQEPTSSPPMSIRRLLDEGGSVIL